MMIRGLLALALVLGLAGCGERITDVGLVDWATGDGNPPAGSPLIRSLSARTGEEEYPNLASVPPRPTDIPTLAQRANDMKALEATRAGSREAAKGLKEMAAPPPPPGMPAPKAVPPKPDPAPGKS